jgi:hypothetical protein
VKNAGRLLSQEAIMEALWPNIFVTENSARCSDQSRAKYFSVPTPTLGQFFACQ